MSEWLTEKVYGAESVRVLESALSSRSKSLLCDYGDGEYALVYHCAGWPSWALELGEWAEAGLIRGTLPAASGIQDLERWLRWLRRGQANRIHLAGYWKAHKKKGGGRRAEVRWTEERGWDLRLEPFMENEASLVDEAISEAQESVSLITLKEESWKRWVAVLGEVEDSGALRMLALAVETLSANAKVEWRWEGVQQDGITELLRCLAEGGRTEDLQQVSLDLGLRPQSAAQMVRMLSVEADSIEIPIASRLWSGVLENDEPFSIGVLPSKSKGKYMLHVMATKQGAALLEGLVGSKLVRP